MTTSYTKILTVKGDRILFKKRKRIKKAITKNHEYIPHYSEEELREMFMKEWEGEHGYRMVKA